MSCVSILRAVALGSALVTACGAPAVTDPTAHAASAAPRASFVGAALWGRAVPGLDTTLRDWSSSRPADAVALRKLATSRPALWLGNWNIDVRADVEAAVSAAQTQGAVPVLVAYNIPGRDCGGVSGANGSMSASAYQRWITELAAGIGDRTAMVLLEPDALADMDCLSATGQQERTTLLATAVAVLAAHAHVAVYLDAGNPRWQTTAVMATRLHAAGVAQAQGFVLNVSNFIATADNIVFGHALAALLGGAHFVIDTGRNGNGSAPDGQWCNPDGRALGIRPTTNTGDPLVDAFLWVKAPGESDGPCGGGPTAGRWFPDYALGLAQRAAY
jgi:endoglucanase